MSSPEERARLLDAAQDPPRSGTWGHRQRSSCQGWEDRADARLARIRALEIERDALRRDLIVLMGWAEEVTQDDARLADDLHGLLSRAQIDVRLERGHGDG